MWLALSGRFRARWSLEIHNEWKRNLLKNRPDLTVQAQHPDEFVDNLFHLDPTAVLSAAERQRSQLKTPTMEVGAYLELLLRQGLVLSVESLGKYRAML